MVPKLLNRGFGVPSVSMKKLLALYISSQLLDSDTSDSGSRARMLATSLPCLSSTLIEITQAVIRSIEHKSSVVLSSLHLLSSQSLNFVVCFQPE